MRCISTLGLGPRGARLRVILLGGKVSCAICTSHRGTMNRYGYWCSSRIFKLERLALWDGQWPYLWRVLEGLLGTVGHTGQGDAWTGYWISECLGQLVLWRRPGKGHDGATDWSEPCWEVARPGPWGSGVAYGKRRFGRLGSSPARVRGRGSWVGESYLVDPASSHMLVSKIKPCMS